MKGMLSIYKPKTYFRYFTVRKLGKEIMKQMPLKSVDGMLEENAI